MEILILLVLILVNGFFALSEIALVSSKHTRLEEARLNGSKGANFALRLQDESENFLSAIQVGITLIGIVTGVYGGVNLAGDVAPLFRQVSWLSAYAEEIALTLTVLVITYISIVLGELVPKTVALSNPEKVAIRVSPVIFYFSHAFYPLVKVLSASTNFINRLIGLKKPESHLTESELRQMIKMASMEGVIEQEQNSIHENVFYFSDKKAKHLMTHRTDIEWIDISKPPDEVDREIRAARHSKLVCSKGDLDHFAGLLYLKDYFEASRDSVRINLEELIVQPLIIPESTRAQNVLKLLRNERYHVCFVVNEYGGFEGLITLHDIMENIVGQIPDEGEPEEPMLFEREDKSVLVSGDAPIEMLTDIIEDFRIDFEKIDYSTVAGFVLNQIRKIPQIGDKLVYGNYTIEIVDIDGNRIDKVLVEKNIS